MENQGKVSKIILFQ